VGERELNAAVARVGHDCVDQGQQLVIREEGSEPRVRRCRSDGLRIGIAQGHDDEHVLTRERRERRRNELRRIGSRGSLGDEHDGAVRLEVGPPDGEYPDEFLAPMRIALAGFLRTDGGRAWWEQRKNWFITVGGQSIDEILSDPEIDDRGAGPPSG
jgi:hypothetical protein